MLGFFHIKNIILFLFFLIKKIAVRDIYYDFLLHGENTSGMWIHCGIQKYCIVSFSEACKISFGKIFVHIETTLIIVGSPYVKTESYVTMILIIGVWEVIMKTIANTGITIGWAFHFKLSKETNSQSLRLQHSTV